MGKVAKLLEGSSVIEERKGNDTIRLWESYKDQAILWRTIALLQMPTTLLALITALIFFHSRKIMLHVPRQPLPGQYSAQEIPDEIWVEYATSFTNAVESYTPANARKQFLEARRMVSGSYLTQFDDDLVGNELRAIESTGRTQMYFIDPTKSVVLRSKEGQEAPISVEFSGLRYKVVGGKELSPLPTKVTVKLGTSPRNAINPYGIVVLSSSREALVRK